MTVRTRIEARDGPGSEEWETVDIVNRRGSVLGTLYDRPSGCVKTWDERAEA